MIRLPDHLVVAATVSVGSYRDQQIMVMDLHNRKVGVLARGRDPVVVLLDSPTVHPLD